MTRPRLVLGARAGGGETGDIQTAELPALDELVARRDLLQHAGRRVPRAEEIQAEMTEARIGAGLGDDGAHPGSDVDAPRPDRHLAGRDRDAEHPGTLTSPDERERRELDADRCSDPTVAGHVSGAPQVGQRVAAPERIGRIEAVLEDPGDPRLAGD